MESSTTKIFGTISSSSNNGNLYTNHCFRILCVLTLTQVVFSAFNFQKYIHRSRSRSSSLQFSSAGGAVHVHSSSLGSSTSNSALHISFAESSTTPSQEASTIEEDNNGLLPEWNLLSKPAQQELKQLLSYEKVSTFDYPDLFRLDELTQGHSLLFMSWAILASPYSQPLLLSSRKGNHKYLNLLQELNLSPTKFYNLVRAIEEGYPKSNPYHNRIHAADVLQTMHSLLETETNIVTKSLSATEHFCILLSAILHDVGHDGTNNPFHIQRQSSLAQQFQNVSVLEQYHVQVGLELLQASGLLDGLSKAQQEEIQEYITDAILHTDMAKHHDQVQAYKDGNWKDDAYQQACYLLHLCDISNPTKSSALIWTEFVLEEFYQIGDQQKSMGLPVTPNYFDRKIADKVSIQQGFLKYMVVPAFEVVDFQNPKIMQGLQANLDYWMSQEKKNESSSSSS